MNRGSSRRRRGRSRRRSGSRCRDRSGGWGWSRHWCRGGRAGVAAIEVIEHVLAGDAPPWAGASDRIDVETVLVDESPHDWREQPAVSHCLSRRRRGRARSRRRRGSRRGSRSRRRSGSRRGCRRGCRRRSRSRLGCGRGSGCCRSVTDHGDDGADLDRLTLGDANLRQHAGHWRRHLGVHLVGRHLEKWLIRRDRVTDRLEPLGDRALGHGLAELRECHICHVEPLWGVSFRILSR